MEHLNHVECLKPKKLKSIDFMSFLMGFSQAVLAYVMSSYFKEASGTDNVGIYYFVSYIIVLVALLNFHKVIRKFGKYRVFSFIFIFKIAVIAGLIFLPTNFFGILFLMGYIILGTLGWSILDIILESFSVDCKSGRIRGLYLTIVNAGFIFGPYLSSQFLDNFGFGSIFIISLVFHVIQFFIGYRSFKGVNHEHIKKETIGQLLKRVSGRMNIIRVYYIAFVLDFFYGIMIIFTPLYLLDLGMNWDEIGLIFTVMLVPFVLLQYPVGVLADKSYGEKNFIIFSLVVILIFSTSIFFISTKSIFIWMVVMFSTRIGAAVLEAMRDSYFYKRVDGNDVDLIDFFRTARPVAYIASTSLSSLLLFFYPTKSVFLLLGFVVLVGLYPAFRLDNNSISKE